MLGQPSPDLGNVSSENLLQDIDIVHRNIEST